MSESQLELESLLAKVAETQNIPNYETILDVSSIRGEGFVGEFFLAGIKNKDTKKTLQVAIKKALQDPVKRAEVRAALAYENEIYFFQKVYPTLNRFQLERGLKDPFVEVAKFYYGSLKECHEALVLENLKAEGYLPWEKAKLMLDEPVRAIFKAYAKYHALSYALRDQEPDTYKELVSGVTDFLEKVMDDGVLKTLIDPLAKDAFDAFDPVEFADLKKHCAKYRDDSFGELLKAMHYKSEFPVILHGDSWSGNYMFKYKPSGDLESIRMVDFQVISEGSPVRDLSYFFYSGAHSSLYEKLDDYLRFYHDTILQTVQELGCNPKNIITFEQLKREWTISAKYGVLISIALMKIKLMDEAQVQSIVKDKEGEEESSTLMDSMLKVNIDTEEWTRRVHGFILHAYKTKVL